MLGDLEKLKFEFWFEFGSTYSYITAMRIKAIAWRHEIEIDYRPFLLGPIFQKQGWETSPFLLFPAKGAYMWRDMERICDDQGIAFQKPSAFPRNGLLASRIVCAYIKESWISKFINEVYVSNFAADQEISSLTVIKEILERMKLPYEEIFAKASSFEIKEALRVQTDLAISHGIFGAPTFRVGKEIFWGNDRLESAIEWYKRMQMRLS